MESVTNIQKMVDAAKEDAIRLAKQLVEMLDALKKVGVADAILTDKAFRKTIAALGVSDQPATPKAKGKKGKSAMSAEGRKRISEAAKKRWAKVKKEGKNSL